MTTKTVEELAKESCSQLLPIRPGEVEEIQKMTWQELDDYLQRREQAFFIRGFLACESKLAAGDGAYNLGYERASSRWRPRKINPEDESTWPPREGDFFVNTRPGLAGWRVQNLSEADDAYYGDWCRSACFYSWFALPQIEGEK